jgi:hypothetical protein
VTDLVPDSLPLRNIEVPREVTAVAGCTCGGMTFHRTQTNYEPPGSGCALWSLPPEQARAAVEAAEDRLCAFTDSLNVKLRAALSAGSVEP